MAKKLLDTIKFLLRLISCISICLLVVIVFMQVINRNFFDHSFTWVEEVASMAMVFITYLGAAMATINNGNTRIDFFIRKLPTPVYNAFELLDDVICIAFLVIVSTIAYKQMMTSWPMQTPALRLPPHRRAGRILHRHQLHDSALRQRRPLDGYSAAAYGQRRKEL